MPGILKKILEPLLQWLARRYASKERSYRYGQIVLRIFPGVFHPGLFFSTKTLIDYLDKQDLKGIRLLELGAGSGLLSIYCYQKAARVTASDISKLAIENLKVNSKLNQASIEIVESDLFDSLNPDDFDWIIINPPFYPLPPQNDAERAWYCGPDFEYFQKLFGQLREKRKSASRIIMILSQDCDLTKIRSIALRSSYEPVQVIEQENWWEKSLIIEWGRSKH